jgi:hypothetical protein
MKKITAADIGPQSSSGRHGSATDRARSPPAFKVSISSLRETPRALPSSACPGLGPQQRPASAGPYHAVACRRFGARRYTKSESKYVRGSRKRPDPPTQKSGSGLVTTRSAAHNAVCCARHDQLTNAWICRPVRCAPAAPARGKRNAPPRAGRSLRRGGWDSPGEPSPRNQPR